MEPTQALHTLVRGRAAFRLLLLPGLTLQGAEEEALCLPACSPRLATRDPPKFTLHVCGSLLMSEGGTWATFLSQENCVAWGTPGERSSELEYGREGPC